MRSLLQLLTTGFFFPPQQPTEQRKPQHLLPVDGNYTTAGRNRAALLVLSRSSGMKIKPRLGSQNAAEAAARR